MFEEDSVIKAYVSSENDISGYYINPCIMGELTEDKHIESINYSSISLAGIPLVEEYAVEGLLPCRGVKLPTPDYVEIKSIGKLPEDKIVYQWDSGWWYDWDLSGKSEDELETLLRTNIIYKKR